MRDYRNIKAWLESDELTVMIYRQTQSFPKDEIYGLISQLRRAAYSVPANIAEGSARDTNKDYLRFLYIARASLAETQYFVHLSKRLGYLDEKDAVLIEKQMKSAFVRLHRLIESVKKDTGWLGKTMALVGSSVAVGIYKAVSGIG